MIQPDLNGNFDILLQEAEANFNSSRYYNAAKTFEHLLQMCIDVNNYEDMIYFAYRAAVSWSQANQTKRIIQLYQKLAINTMKLSTVLAVSALENSKDLIEKAEFIKLAQENLKFLNEEEKRKPLVEMLLDLYDKFSNDYSLDHNEKVVFIERAIRLLIDIKDNERIKLLKFKLAGLTESNANYTLNNSEFDAELVSAHQLMEAAKLYYEVNDLPKFNELIEKAKALDPSLDLSKLDLSLVENSETL